MSRTLGQVLCWAQRRLTDAGIGEAKLEARILVANALDSSPGALLARRHDLAPTGLTASLAPLLDRRAAREPLAHITGETEFFGLPMETGPGALIPRQDSETLVRVALDLDLIGSQVLHPHIVDLGTGSGCLLIALLHTLPNASGEGIDASGAALSLAKRNATMNGVAGRSDWTLGSWTDWSGWDKADLIVSNPPYIASGVLETLAPEVKDHDPHIALDGGPDGLTAYREIIALAAGHARPGTPLVLEIGFDQADAVSALLQHAGFTDIVLSNDLSGHPRVLSAVKNMT